MSQCDSPHSLISVLGHHAARVSVFRVTTETTQARDGCPQVARRPVPASRPPLPQTGASPPAGSALGDRRALPRADPKVDLVTPPSQISVFIPRPVPLPPSTLPADARGRRRHRGGRGRCVGRGLSRRGSP